MVSARCRVCLRAALLTAAAVLSAVVVLRKAHSLTPLSSRALVEAAEASESAKGLENMDPHAVRLHWFKTECLGVTPTRHNNKSAFRLVVWTCKPMKDAWWRQRFVLPEPGKLGRIKSLVGQVHDDKKREHCLVVHDCVPGTPVLFVPCREPGIHSQFILTRRNDGTIKIGTPQCPREHCIDIPDKNTTRGNYAQVWQCNSSDPDEEAVLKVDEVFSVGISRHDEDVFKAMELSHTGPPSCKLARVPFDKDLLSYRSHCHCSHASNGGTPLSFSANFAPRHDKLGPYATIWSLWCEVRTCSCSALVMGEAFASVTRENRSTACGALMLSTHPTDGTCPPDLVALEGKINASGEVDCTAGQKAVRELSAKPSAHSRLLLAWLKAGVVGLSFQDNEAFAAMKVHIPSGNCTASQPEGTPLVKYAVRCPQAEQGANLSLEITAPSGSSNLSSGSSVWALWCIGDKCKCKAAPENRELVSRELERGQRGCAVLMLTVLPKSGACPPDLVQLQRIIEGSGGDKMDCEAGEAAAGQMAADPDAKGWLRLKWVDVENHGDANHGDANHGDANHGDANHGDANHGDANHGDASHSDANHGDANHGDASRSAPEKAVGAANHSAPNKAVMNVLNFASVVGGVAAIGTVPAWPAMAQFAQFVVLMASNQEQLGVPEQFSGFSREVLKFGRAAKPLEGIPVLSDLGEGLDFLMSSAWFPSKERLMQQRMTMVVHALNSSRKISPHSACLLGNFYDPLQRQLGNLTAALEKHDGEDPCASWGDSATGDNATGRRLADEEAEVDPDEREASDGGNAAANIRQRLEELQDAHPEVLKSLEDEMESTEKDFSATKIDVLCLVVLPVLVYIYLVTFAVLYLLGHKLTFVPDLRPSFLLIFLEELTLLGTLVAWADVLWHKRFLQSENPFRVLLGALEAWDGGSASTPIVSAFMMVVSCFKPVISLLALWDGLHLGPEGSKVVATMAFLQGPCLLLLVCVLHARYGRLGRHERTNRHLDSECRFLRAWQPVLGSFLKGVLRYQSAPIAEVSEVRAGGDLLFQDGRLQGEVCHSSLFDSLRGNQLETRRSEDIQMQVASNHTLLGHMSDSAGKLVWAYQVFGLLVARSGLPRFSALTLVFDGVLSDRVPEVRLHVARGPLVLSVSFQARSGDPRRPLPGPNKLLELELLQSIWSKSLLGAIMEFLRSSGSNNLELSGLRWTLWDVERHERNPWILASFNVQLLRTRGTDRASYVRSASSLRERLLEEVEADPGKWDSLLRRGWVEAEKVLNCLRVSRWSTMGKVADAPVWREIAAQEAKANLTAEQREWAFAEVDLSRVHAAEIDEEDFEVEADGGVQEASKLPVSSPSLAAAAAAPPQAEVQAEPLAKPRAEDRPANENVTTGPDPLVPANRPLAPRGRHPRTTGHGFFNNVSAVTSSQDDHIERPQTDFYRENNQTLVRLTSDTFASLKRGDYVQISLAGKNEDEAPPPDGHDSSSTPLTQPSWPDFLSMSPPRVNVQLEEVKPCDDQSDPSPEVMVTCRRTRDDAERLKAVSRFPKAFVGNVPALLQLPGGAFCDLTLSVTARDLPHLPSTSTSTVVPLRVPPENLQLPLRDLQRAFYMLDHRMRRGELPHVTKIVNSLITFGKVLVVMLLPLMSASGPFTMFVLGLILVIRVSFHCWNDGTTLQFGLATLKRRAKSEWACLVKAFERKKTVTVLVRNLNYAKVAFDPRLSSLLLQVLRGEMGSADPGTMHAEVTVPEDPKDCQAVIYVRAEPRPKKSESTGEVKLEYVKDIDPRDCPGCVPTGVEQGIRPWLARQHEVGDEKGQGWRRQMKASSASSRKLTGIGETFDAATRINVFSPVGKTYSELAEAREWDLQSEIGAFYESGPVAMEPPVAMELTCNNLCAKVEVAASTEVKGADAITTALEREEELQAARVGPLKVAVAERQQQRCPCWLGLLGVAQDVLKLLLVLSVPIVGLADGGNAFQAIFALLLSLALWLLSRLTWTHAVEGSLFRSCTMDIGQIVLVFAVLLCQLEFLNKLSAACITIAGVLWSIVLLFCRSHKDQIKMWQKDISSAVKTVQKSPEAAKEKLRVAFGRFKLRLSLGWRIYWHGVSANTRDPAWRWGVLFALLFFLSVIAIVAAQGPSLVTLIVVIPLFWLFFIFLPRKLLDYREAMEDVGVRHTQMAMDTVKAATMTEDASEQQRVRTMLLERSRAHTPASIDPSPRDVEVPERVPVPVLFEPLGGLAPFSSVFVVVDCVIMTASLLLQSGQVPLKRLLCTPLAWAAPRKLVEHTLVQMNPKNLSVSESTSMPRLGQLVCTLQVVNFVGLSIGKTQDHDGVLSLWISPELDASAQLKEWTKTILRFFWEYGASFEPGSGVYAVLESLIWGISTTRAERGQHLHQDKCQRMLVTDGVPHERWLDRNMRDLVNILRLGPNYPQRQEWGDVSDDEEDPDVLLQIERSMEARPPDGAPPTPRTPAVEGTKGTLKGRVLGATNVPNEISRVICRDLNLETQQSEKTNNPVYNSPINVLDFSFSQQTVLEFQVVRGSDVRSVLASGKLRLQELVPGQKREYKIHLETDVPNPGCCAGKGPASVLTITLCFLEGEPVMEGEADATPPPYETNASDSTTASSPPERTKREQPCAGFCGGPLAWALVYPPTVPQLLHVVLAAEDLRVGAPPARLAPFGSAPHCSGGMPPLREQRALDGERMVHERLELRAAE